MKCSKKELYRIKKILDAPNDVLDLVRKGKMTAVMASKIMYNLKDESKASEVAKEIVTKKLNQVDAEEYVARVNNPVIILNHLHSALWRFNKKLESLLSGPVPEGRQSDFRNAIDEIRVKLARLEKKVGLVKTVKVES